MNAEEFNGFLHKLEGILHLMSVDQLNQIEEAVHAELAHAETALQVHRSILDAIARRTSPKIAGY